VLTTGSEVEEKGLVKTLLSKFRLLFFKGLNIEVKGNPQVAMAQGPKAWVSILGRTLFAMGSGILSFVGKTL